MYVPIYNYSTLLLEEPRSCPAESMNIYTSSGEELEDSITQFTKHRMTFNQLSSIVIT